MTATAAPPPPVARLSAGDRRLAAAMAIEAATLAVFAALHLSGALDPGSGSGPGSSNGYAAGVAEAIIGVVLVLGLRAFTRSPARGRLSALAATGFAIAGFIVGLTFTVQGGATIDLVYHATMFPILIVTALMLGRGAGEAALGGRRRPRATALPNARTYGPGTVAAGHEHPPRAYAPETRGE